MKGKQSIRSQVVGGQNTESDSLLEGDDDTLSSLEEKDLENLTGKLKPHLIDRKSLHSRLVYVCYMLCFCPFPDKCSFNHVT